MMTVNKDRLARDAGEWRNTTIAVEAFKKSRSQPQDVAIYLEDEPDARRRSGKGVKLFINH